jgi:hypothetical protein
LRTYLGAENGGSMARSKTPAMISLEFTPCTPTLARIALAPANIADSNAQTNQFFIARSVANVYRADKKEPLRVMSPAPITHLAVQKPHQCCKAGEARHSIDRSPNHPVERRHWLESRDKAEYAKPEQAREEPDSHQAKN